MEVHSIVWVADKEPCISTCSAVRPDWHQHILRLFLMWEKCIWTSCHAFTDRTVDYFVLCGCGVHVHHFSVGPSLYGNLSVRNADIAVEHDVRSCCDEACVCHVLGVYMLV